MIPLPEIFCWTFTILKSLSARLLSNRLVMFEYFHFDARQIEYLTPFIICDFCIEQRPTARFALCNRMDNLMISFFRHF